MAERSIFWTTGSTGDGATAYTQTDLFNWLSRTFLNDPTTLGVMKNYGLGFAILSGNTSPVTPGSGAAVVNGIPYQSDATLSLAVTTPTIGTTGKAVVLHADYTAQTVRCIIISSADGTAAIPALTQNASIWEIYLWQFTIATNGIITFTVDSRKYLNTALVPAYIDNDGNTNKAFYTQYGHFTVPAGSTVCTFTKVFATLPAVTITPYGTYTGGIVITAISSSSFTVSNTSGGSLPFSFIAIGGN